MTTNYWWEKRTKHCFLTCSLNDLREKNYNKKSFKKNT